MWFLASSKTSCSKEMFSTGFPWRRAGNGQVGPARVTQPRCPCLALGTGERPFSVLCRGSMGLPRFWGHRLHPLIFATGASPQFGGWQGTGSSQSLPLLLAPALPFTRTSQQDHIPTIYVHFSRCPSHAHAQAHGRRSGDRVTPALPEQAAAKRRRKAHFRSN